MQYAYLRVSTSERQTVDLQMDALKAAGCEKFFEDKMSGARDDRPGLNALLEEIQPGDILTVWKLDRLGRSVPHLLSIIAALQERGIEFRSLTETIDTRTPSGRFVTTVLIALCQMEREILIQRTRAGIEAARLRGRVGGRPPKMSAEQARIARQLLDDPSNSVASIRRSMGIAKSTFYRLIKNGGN